MSEKKTIQINPDLFRFSTTNKTRKKRDNPNKPIKIKSPSKSVSSKTVRNRLLKYIRQQQDANHGKQTTSVATTNSVSDPTFESDFENSLKYLSTIAEKTQHNVSPEYKQRHNATIRQFEKGLPPTTESLLYGPTLDNALFDTNVGIELPDVFAKYSGSDAIELRGTLSPFGLRERSSSEFTQSESPLRLAPKYGCLKNGILPTYRMWKNQTARAPTSVRGGYVQPAIGRHSREPTPTQESRMKNNPFLSRPDIATQRGSQGFTESEGRSKSAIFGRDEVSYKNTSDSGERSSSEFAEMKKHHERKKMAENRPRPKPLFRKLKQKRTLRRTYHVGKSKHYPKVGVLVSNKTLRKKITTNAQLLKQVPMDEVKKTLIKKGFIKVGSTAPTDVLRKMFESVSLVCGEIQNHNPDNLLYNYLNGTD
jgi:hypothetical protein